MWSSILDKTVGRFSDDFSVGSICTGAFVLARAGLLDGRRATTQWEYAKQLATGFPKISGQKRTRGISFEQVNPNGHALSYSPLKTNPIEHII
jgi:putative intracellular protease/amidase